MAGNEGGMNSSLLSGLVAEWRDKADTLRKFGATGQAEAVECCAAGLEEAGYVNVRNDNATDGRWKVGGRNVAIYAQRELSLSEQIAAARRLAETAR